MTQPDRKSKSAGPESGEPARDGPTVIKQSRITQDGLIRIHQLHQRYLQGRRNGWRIRLHDCDLSSLDLQSMNFSEGDFLACDFSRANLANVRLACTNLFGANFDRANLSDADLQRADLRGANFNGAELDRVSMEGADLRRGAVIRPGDESPTGREQSSFRYARLANANLSHCKLRGADFEGALLDRTDLRSADLRDASFAHAELKGVQLGGANLTDADMRQAIVDDESGAGVDLSRARRARRTPSQEQLRSILEQHLLWINSDRRAGRRADFSATDLSGVDLSKTVLASANFRGAVLDRTNLAGAMLAAADFQDAALSRTDLAGADLRGADFRGANLDNVRDEGATVGELEKTGAFTRS